MKKICFGSLFFVLVFFSNAFAESSIFEKLHCQKKERSTLGNIVILYEVQITFSSSKVGHALFFLTPEGQSRTEICKSENMDVDLRSAQFELNGQSKCMDGSRGKIKLTLSISTMNLHMGSSLPYQCAWIGSPI